MTMAKTMKFSFPHPLDDLIIVAQCLMSVITAYTLRDFLSFKSRLQSIKILPVRIVNPAHIHAAVYPKDFLKAPPTGGPNSSANDITEKAIPNLVPILRGSPVSLTNTVGCIAKKEPVMNPWTMTVASRRGAVVDTMRLGLVMAKIAAAPMMVFIGPKY